MPGRLYGFNHHRAYGTQTKLLRRFVREKKLLTVEQAVRKITSLSAAVLGMKNRVIPAEGAHADVTVFDPDAVADASTFSELQRAPTGIHAVIVNGVIALR